VNQTVILGLKILRKSYSLFFGSSQNRKPESIQAPDVASFIIYDALMNDESCLIGSFGKTEMRCLANYIGVKTCTKDYQKYIQGKMPSWWWEKSTIRQMQRFGVFFPVQDQIEQFCELMTNDIPELNVLGSWLPQERFFNQDLLACEKIASELLTPFFSTIPWTMALKGKKVLVVHSLASTIQNQYLKRDLLFKNELLPTFELQTIDATQYIAGNSTAFKDWFEVLECMKSAINNHDFDICLIGGYGAHGFPVAAHVKRMGKKAVLMGGSLQLLFGIWGHKWNKSNYNSYYKYGPLVNEHWVKS
jgi:hypothetical protein